MTPQYLKQMITPIELAQRLLGKPITRKSNASWYKSPFRAEERTASFEVSERGFHDFGTGEHFDIISFTKRIYNCNFKEACNILANLYGLQENEYDNKRIKDYLEKQRLANKKHQEEIEKWYLNFFNFVENAWEENEFLIQCLQDYDETLSVLYSRQIFLGCLREDLLNTDTFEEKEKLKNEVTKEGLPEWMQYQKGYSLILGN